MTATRQNETTPQPLPGRHEPAPARMGDTRTVEGRLTEIGALPPRWFPADKDKLIYLAMSARVGPAVIEHLGRLPDGSHFEDLTALMRAARRTPRPSTR